MLVQKGIGRWSFINMKCENEKRTEIKIRMNLLSTK